VIKSISHEDFTKIIKQEALDIRRLLTVMRQEDYHTSLLWPLIWSSYLDFTNDYVPSHIRWFIGDTCFVGQFTESSAYNGTWIVPLVNDVSLIAEEVTKFNPDNLINLCSDSMVLALFDYDWEPMEYDDDSLYLDTAGLQTFNHRRLRRKRSGVLRYDDQLAEGNLRILDFNQADYADHDLVPSARVRQLRCREEPLVQRHGDGSIHFASILSLAGGTVRSPITGSGRP